MTARTAAELQQIGLAVAQARAVGVRWKVLERHYKLGRARLNQLWRAARAAPTNMSIDISAVENRLPAEAEA